MKVNILFIYFLILLQIKNIKGRSEEFNKCINLERTIIAPSDCTDIKIPDSDGYKCCSMKIVHNNNNSYSCLAIENKYTASQQVLNEYISKTSISFLFSSAEGQMEIECGNELKISENYKKLSNEYLNCYNNHIKGIEDENDCFKNDIPASEGSKCCFVLTSTENYNGNIINDKRCYMIKDKYFTENKNLSNYLLDESNINDLDEIVNTNITINCKNYDTFFFKGPKQKKVKQNKNNEDDDNNGGNANSSSSNIKSGLKTWAIILVAISCIFG